MALALQKVELHCKENNKTHNTNEISVNRLMVRRGKPFLLTLQMGSYDASALDQLEITVRTGPEASEALGTKAIFRISPVGVTKNSWNANIQEKTLSTVTLSITSPAGACIGEYSLTIKTKSSSTEFSSDIKFTLLFNPWCTDDWVYMPEDNDRKEYVMNEHGLVYTGSSDYINSKAWNFGQFEEDIVDICLKLMDKNLKCLRNAKKDFSARCNPIYVSRVLCAMINSQDDGGVLVGCWDGKFTGGTPPTSWNSSVEILRSWAKSCQPVKYGQCWVFASVLCTVLRCVGIPARVVTNFDSAHDTDGNLLVDIYRTEDGHVHEDDSIWNFHVWVEAWMKRPDLQGNFYDGWQVVDPTPQEKSEEVYCCGPAPVKAIHEGHVDVKYDVPFIYAEVNADVNVWKVTSNGCKTMLSSDTKQVGQKISTKAVGMNKRVDITNNYKYVEGTKNERQAFEEAVRRETKLKQNTTIPPPDSCGLQLKIVEVSKPINGKDISLSLVLNSSNQALMKLQIHLLAQIISYNGVPGATIWTNEQETVLPSKNDMSIPIQIPYSLYATQLGRNSIKVSAVITDREHTEMGFHTEKNIVPENPKLTITMMGLPCLYREMTANVVFYNTAPMELTDCKLTVSGSGLLKQPMEISLPSLKPRYHCHEIHVPFTPSKTGPRQLVANFDSNLFRDITASITIDVKAPPNAPQI